MAIGKGRPDGSPGASPGPNPEGAKAPNPAAKPQPPMPRPVSSPGVRPPTGENKGPGQARQRTTQMISLEPPKKRPGPRLAPNSRMDNIAARQRSDTEGGELILHGVQPEQMKVFEVTGLAAHLTFDGDGAGTESGETSPRRARRE